MRHLVERRGLSDKVSVDSAGTAAYHAGEPPDRRSAAAAKRRGIEVLGRARQFVRSDFERFDYVLALDQANFAEISALAGPHLSKVSLLRAFDPDSEPGASVPDPYFGGESGFEEVLDLCETACAHLLDELVVRHNL